MEKLAIVHIVVVIVSSLALVATVLAFIIPKGSSDNKPLFLTPLLKTNDVAEARKQSQVSHAALPSSYSGYITVDETLGNHLFFWFFPNQNNQNAPLILWLNGGPGVSSMVGLFWEHGPIEVVPGGGDNGKATFKPRNITWAEDYSIVYVDSPVGTGYSYSDSGEDGYRITQEDYSNDLYSFVKQFFQLFPEHKTGEFYIGGQSYAGKFVPSLAIKIHEGIVNDNSDIPLTGIFLGSPLFDMPNQMRSSYKFYYALGVMSHADVIAFKEGIEKLFIDHANGLTKNMTLLEISQIIMPPRTGMGAPDNYVTQQRVDIGAIGEVLDEGVGVLIHAGANPVQVYSSGDHYNSYNLDIFESSTAHLASLMDIYKVLIYSGDFDPLVSPVMVDDGLMKVPWTYQALYNETGRRPWVVDNDLLGFYSSTGRFCRVNVHRAGHQTPHDQPEATMRMMREFISHGCIQDSSSSPAP